MSQLDYRLFTSTIASATTTGTEVDIDRSYRKVYLDIPASSVGNIEVWGSTTKAGTFKPLYKSAATASIASAVSNMMVDLDDYGYVRHCKVIATTAPANGAAYNFVCVE
jgi:hypothetical protein